MSELRELGAATYSREASFPHPPRKLSHKTRRNNCPELSATLIYSTPLGRHMTATLFFVLGAAASWLISHIYYRLSSTTLPEWAYPLIRELPNSKPSPRELLEIVQEYLDLRLIEIKEPINRIACPKCGNTARDFIEKYHTTDDGLHSLVSYKCPTCGWQDIADYERKQ